MNIYPRTLSAKCFLFGLLSTTAAYAAPSPSDAKANANMDRAVTLLQQGKLNEADAAFQQTIALAPSDFDASLGRAQVAISQNQLDKADRIVSEVLRNKDQLPEAHNMGGVVLLLRKDNVGAKREFLRAIQLKPEYITPHLYLGAMARNAGDYSGAEAEYRSLVHIAPKLPAGYLGAADALAMQHREGDAIHLLQTWKQADPSTLLPYKVIAEIYLSDHKPHDAVTELKSALAKKPSDSGTLTVLGDTYRALGDIPAAATQYDAALAANRSNASAAVSLGELEASAGQNDRALQHFRAALAADPQNALAANDTAWLLTTQGKDLDEAQRLAQMAIKTNPKYGDAYDTLGWVQYHRGQYAAAVPSFQQAQTLMPDNPDVAAHLGMTYAKLGRKAEATTQLQRALKSNSGISNRAEAQAALTQLSSASAQR